MILHLTIFVCMNVHICICTDVRDKFGMKPYTFGSCSGTVRSHLHCVFHGWFLLSGGIWIFPALELFIYCHLPLISTCVLSCVCVFYFVLHFLCLLSSASPWLGQFGGNKIKHNWNGLKSNKTLINQMVSLVRRVLSCPLHLPLCFFHNFDAHYACVTYPSNIGCYILNT